TPEDTEAVLEDRVLPLGVLQRPTSVQDAYDGRVAVQVRAYPNPTSAGATVEWQQSTPGHVTIELYGTDGRFIETVHRGTVQPGRISVPVMPRSSGSYLCNVIVNGIGTSVPLSVMR
ncbi:MAG: T9SS C-terminal target domain-containing protein, partial [Ignavibacteriae bacterium]